MQAGQSDRSIAQIAELAKVAVRHLQQSQFAEALDAFQRLIAVRPDNADDWFNLGYLHRCLRQFHPSLDAYQRALTLGVSQPEEVHVNRAAILMDHLDRSEDAQIELEKALSLNPRYITAWLNLGNLHEDCGRQIEARSAYEAALAIYPANGRAHARIAAIDIFEGKSAQAAENLQQKLARAANDREDIAEMQFALGHAMDDQGRFDEAWAAFSAANSLAYGMLDPLQRYNPQAHKQHVQDIKCTFRTRIASSIRDVPAPIFICGMFRSGSTLAEQILSRHSRVTAGGEREFIPAIIGDQLQPYPQAAQPLTDTDFAAFAKTYNDNLKELQLADSIFTDKRPDNFLHIGLIKSIFPNAKIIHTFRNTVDNILSIYFLYFASSVSYGFRIPDIVHYIDQYRELMDHWKKLYPDDIYDLDYDEVVKYPEDQIRRLFEFCGIDWEPQCLKVPSKTKAVKTASNWQVRQPLHNKSSGRWKNYEKFLSQYADISAF